MKNNVGNKDTATTQSAAGVDTSTKQSASTVSPMLWAVAFIVLIVGTIALIVAFQTRQSVSTLQIKTNSLDNRVTSAVVGLQQKSAVLTASVQTLFHQTNQAQVAWVLAEVEYLLGAARYALVFERNPISAIKLLVLADDRVNALNSSDLQALHRAIAKDIKQLQAMPAVQVGDLITQIHQVSALVSVLPPLPKSAIASALAQRLKAEETATAHKLHANTALPKADSSSDKTAGVDKAAVQATDVSKTPDKAYWWLSGRDAFLKVRQKVAQLFSEAVIIKTHQTKGQAERLLSPGRHAFLLENVRLQLSQAAWAVLHHQSSLYKLSLRNAKTWLVQYYPYTTAALKTIVSQLTTLESVNVDPNLPTLHASLSLLRKTKIQLQQRKLMPVPKASSTTPMLDSNGAVVPNSRPNESSNVSSGVVRS